MRRAVVTGLGVVSALGRTTAEVSAALRAGESGVVSDPERTALGFSSSLTARLRGWDGGRSGLNRKARKSMGEAALYAAVAAQDAIADAGLDPARLRRDDVGVIVGNDSTVAASADTVARLRDAGYTGALGSGAIFQLMNSTVTMNLAVLFGIRGASWTMSAACASGAHSLGQAQLLIGSGQQEIVLAGGAQELNWHSMAAFDALRAFASEGGDPTRASRPFSADRDGLVPSGGAAMLVIESESHARNRGATIYGYIAGYAFSSNGNHLTEPTVDGPVRCMRKALHQAGLGPTEVDYINAHATATPVGDLVEGRALLEVFGADGPPVSSTKSLTGHECWMSGASEVLYSLLMMRDGFLAPNANLTRLDPELAGLNVIPETVVARPSAVLSNAFGFGGTNSSLVVRSL